MFAGQIDFSQFMEFFARHEHFRQSMPMLLEFSTHSESCHWAFPAISSQDRGEGTRGAADSMVAHAIEACDRSSRRHKYGGFLVSTCQGMVSSTATLAVVVTGGETSACRPSESSARLQSRRTSGCST